MGCNLFHCLRHLIVHVFSVKISSRNFLCCNFCSLPAILSLHREYKETGFIPSASWKAAETAGIFLPPHPSFLWTEEVLSASSQDVFCTAALQVPLWHRALLLQMQDSHLPLLGFTKFLPAHFSSLMTSL